MRLPDIVPVHADDDTLRQLYGSDADEVIAFRRFLGFDRNEDGKIELPQPWYDYATGKITGADALRIEASSGD